MKNLNLGCGRDYRPDWDNWDNGDCKVDEVVDISKDIFPAKDETYDKIYCSGVFEQVIPNDQFVHAMNESHRVLKVGGVMTVIVPSAKYSNAFKDPFDGRKFTEETFKYFDKGSQEYKLYGSVYGFKPWNILTIFTAENGIITCEMKK